MKNLEQIRARNALRAVDQIQHGDLRGEDKGDVLTGFPALIITNGLLATIAFSMSKSKVDKKTDSYKKSGHEQICDFIAEHLQDGLVGALPIGTRTADAMLKWLTHDKQTSSDLRLCTAETLAYLNYLRRFAKTAKKTTNQREG